MVHDQAMYCTCLNHIDKNIISQWRYLFVHNHHSLFRVCNSLYPNLSWSHRVHYSTPFADTSE